jgi:uncharacterized protein DUF5819
MTSLIRDWLANGLRVAVLAALAIHFALTGVYVLHENPLSRALAPLLDSYMNRYFDQAWGLFAPNPLSANLSLMVRPLNPVESAAVARQGVPKTGWYDLTRALWERRQRMPFSSDEALGHFHVVTIQDYLGGDPAGFSSLYACREDSAAACEAAKAEQARAREGASLYLWRLGSGFVNARFSASAYPAMALKIHEELPMPWRERGGSGRRQTRDILLGVYATDPARAPMPAPAVAVLP